MTIGSEGRVPSAPDRNFVLTLRLRNRRRSLGLTQKQVVRRLADYGVVTTNKALSSLEHGAGVDVAKLPEFAAALECTVTYLLGLTEDPDNWHPDGPLARRPPIPIGPTVLPSPDIEAPDRHTRPPVRREPEQSDSEDGTAATTSWILGPYPSGA
jgi:transcriptional regulator with XRE-family HTH domain